MKFETLQILWLLFYFVTNILLIPGSSHFIGFGTLVLQRTVKPCGHHFGGSDEQV